MLSGLKRLWRTPARRLALARAAFLLPAGLSIGLLLVMVPINLITARFDWRLGTTHPLIARYVSLQTYADLWVAFNYAVAIVCIVVVVVVIWRKANDRVAWLAGVVLVCFPGLFNLGGYTDTWSYYPLAWRGVFEFGRSLVQFIALHAIVLFIFLFPDGKVLWRWMRWSYGVYAMGTSALAVGLRASTIDPNITDWVWTVWMASILLTLLLGLAAQFIRYQRRSTQAQRQQTKWVVAGFTLWVVVILVEIAVSFLVPEESPAGRLLLLFMGPVLSLSLLLVPATLAFSILRYRLWDIDHLVQRTLLYAALTGTLAALYLGSVIVLQSGLRAVTGQAQSPVVTVISTLIIAAVAGPLRRRLQDALDRRFNRRRYDAARTLQAFGSAMRDNSVADLERLNHQLVGVVQDTLEPEKVSLWLRS